MKTKSKFTNQLLIDLLLLGAAAMVCYALCSFRALWNPDETRYSLIPLTMLESGDWTIPHLNYVPYFEKPIMTYWLTALSYLFFDFSPFTGRLVPIVFALIGIFFTYALGRSMFDRKTGLVAGFITATAVEYTALAVSMTTDMIFSVFLFGVWFFVWKLNQLPDQAGWKTKLPVQIGLWTCMHLAFMTKGPLAMILSSAVIGAFIVLGRNFRLLLKPGYIVGTILFLLICLPWHIGVWNSDPRFLNFFYIRENFKAFFDGSIHHEAHPFYYFGTYFGGFFPWSFAGVPALFCALAHTAKTRLKNTDAKTLYLLCVIVPIFGFFSMASAKLHTYILPIFPALSILTASYLMKKFSAPTKTAAAGFVINFLLLATALAVFLMFQVGNKLDYELAKQALFATDTAVNGITIVAFLIITMGVGAYFAATRKLRSAVAVVIAGMLCFYPLLFSFLGSKVLIKTSQNLAEQIPQEAIAPDDFVISSDKTDYSLPLFFKKQTALVGLAGEIGFGFYTDANPGAGMMDFHPYTVSASNVKNPYLLNYPMLYKKWKQPGRIWFFIRNAHIYKDFNPLAVNCWMVAKNPRTTLLTNKPVKGAVKFPESNKTKTVQTQMES